MSNRKKPSSPSPLREALKKKTSLRTYFDVAIADTDQVEEAVRRVNAAQQLVTATLLSDDQDVRVRADRALDEARAARAACFHRVEFRGLGPKEFDALVDLHPPTDEQAKAEDPLPWNTDTFPYALLEAATVDSDLTAAEWEAELADEAKWTRADRNGLITAVLAAQRQTMADAVPKD